MAKTLPATLPYKAPQGTTVPICKDIINTKFGTLFLQDEGLIYDEAARACESNCKILAPLTTTEQLLEVGRLAVDCRRSDGRLVKRTERGWYVGLKLVLGNGRFSNGMKYDPTVHKYLFLEGFEPSPKFRVAHGVLLPRSRKLLTQFVNRKEKYICMNSPTKDAARCTGEDSNLYTHYSAEKVGGIVLPIVLAILLISIIFKYWSIIKILHPKRKSVREIRTKVFQKKVGRFFVRKKNQALRFILCQGEPQVNE